MFSFYNIFKCLHYTVNKVKIPLDVISLVLVKNSNGICKVATYVYDGEQFCMKQAKTLLKQKLRLLLLYYE